MTNLTASRLSEQLLEVRVPYECSSGKIEANFLLLSDIHLDNPKCDRKLLISHLEKCKEMGGSVLMFGDVLCLMQGKKDRRGSKGSVRPEHMGDNYFDLVFRESAEFLRPYASMILMMGDGNHETAVINNQEINPLDNVARLMKEDGSRVEHMNYQGFVRFVFSKNGGSVRRCTLFFHHGTWGGIITKGVMGGGRYAQIAPDADVIVNGHNHERSIVSHPCYRVADNGNVWIEQRWHVQCGTYKNEFSSGAGWATEKIVMPKSLGGIWMRLRPRKSGGVEISLMPAC